jgi:hypothetical protein
MAYATNADASAEPKHVPVSTYLLMRVRLLRDVCRAAGGDEDGRRCPTCSICDLCAKQVQRAEGAAV